ncbi:C2 domain-containing protein [Glutamicibacter ardleyensis]|uniref:Uncharacterized protein n=1 Tax=Glutamicibacter ardleyensis TaxID=225894 RepID=A0ABQ2DZX8_9MICC|nr:hypothetical protein [Glutamicibacter ardleyensis]GGJ74486.1 hypothetical protein GCM10007173_36840 [Glutamicibacter ardleyensis]
MSTVIEARRLNGTDLKKTVEAQGVKGTLCAVSHAVFRDADNKLVPFVQINIDGTPHVFRPSDKITITGRKVKPDA